MKKLLLTLITVTACGQDHNLATVMVQAQAPKASCEGTSLRGVDVAICEIPGKDKVIPYIAVYGKKLSQAFQAYPLEALPKQEPAQAPAAPTPTPTPTPTPAGEGSGANAPGAGVK